MTTYGGCVCEYPKPTPVSSADIARGRLVIRYGQSVVEATSVDGFRYDGHYGRHRPSPNRTVTLYRYDGRDGSVVLYGEWSNCETDGGCGEWCFRLFPRNVANSDPIEIPAAWGRVEAAVVAVQRRVAPTRVATAISLLMDRRFGRRVDTDGDRSPGLYVLFAPIAGSPASEWRIGHFGKGSPTTSLTPAAGSTTAGSRSYPSAKPR